MKQGMLMHPFSDQSGVSFFNPQTSEITSIGLELSAIEKLLASSHPLTEDEQSVIKELLSKDFIETVAAP